MRRGVRIPDRAEITANTPLSLDVAARIAFPDGSMSGLALRNAATRGDLGHARIGGRVYTGDNLFRLLSHDPAFENARVIVKLIGHLAELRYDRVVLRGQRSCQFAAKLSLLAEIGSCGTHDVKMTKFAQNASHNSVRTRPQAVPDPSLSILGQEPHRQELGTLLAHAALHYAVG